MKIYIVTFLLLVTLFNWCYTVHSSTTRDQYLPAICANGETIRKSEYEADRASFKTCPYNRTEAVDWMKEGFDLNGDGYVTMEECIVCRNEILTWYEKPIAENCELIFRHCDCDGDGRIYPEDFLKAEFTCLRNCDTVMAAHKYIYKRVKDRGIDGSHSETWKRIHALAIKKAKKANREL